jgi:hypothetical protein
MATVALSSKDETPDHQVATVTIDNFRSWKRKQGRDTAFVVQMQGANDEDDQGSQILVSTFSDMRKLPTGSYQAQLVRKCAIPEAAKKQLRGQLRGTDLWKCV